MPPHDAAFDAIATLVQGLLCCGEQLRVAQALMAETALPEAAIHNAAVAALISGAQFVPGKRCGVDDVIRDDRSRLAESPSHIGASEASDDHSEGSDPILPFAVRHGPSDVARQLLASIKRSSFVPQLQRHSPPPEVPAANASCDLNSLLAACGCADASSVDLSALPPDMVLVTELLLRHPGANPAFVAARQIGSAGSAGSEPEASHSQSTTLARESCDEDGSRIINQYVLLSSIGHGAQGTVHLAQVAGAGDNEVAIKVLQRPRIRENANSNLQRNQHRQLKFMTQEIMAMHKCRHKNLVRVLEVIDDPQSHQVFLVMELVGRGCLAKAVGGNGLFDRRYTPRRVAFFGRRLCAALQYLHERGIFHRDIKPENILLRDDGEPCFCDFGVCDVVEYVAPAATASRRLTTRGSDAGGLLRFGSDVRPCSRSSEAGSLRALSPGNAMSFRGTEAFAPPECHGIVLPQSQAPSPDAADNRFAADVWSLGVALYALLYGCTPMRVDRNYLEYVRRLETMELAFPPTWAAELPGLALGEAAKDDVAVPPALVGLLRQMMHPDRELRIGIDEAHAAFKALDKELAATT